MAFGGPQNKISMKDVKLKAKKLDLKYLSNIEWKEGRYTLEEYADGFNPTSICFGDTWEDALKMAEESLQDDTAPNYGDTDTPRHMKGIGKDVKNFDDYEIRVLRVNDEEFFDGRKWRAIELSVGKKEVEDDAK